jgi:phospholipase C
LSTRASAILVAVLATIAIAAPIVLESEGLIHPFGAPWHDPIQHIVVLLMENRAYDNLFGAYCTSVGPNCPQAAVGIPSGDCVPENPLISPTPCIAPYPTGNLSLGDLSHSYNSSVNAINGGQMNDFYKAEGNSKEPFAYYPAGALPIYWDLAQQYALGDYFFSSAVSYSLPNHWYLLAGQAPALSFNWTFTNSTPRSTAESYLNEANHTKSVEDLLNQTPGVTWRYYDWALPAYQQAISKVSGIGAFSAWDYWNPQAAKAESYSSWYVNHFVPRDTFFSDAQNGTLPDISWIMPGVPFSDHPPANLTDGESFVASVVNSVESSPDWSSTALFLAWDDYGGFYDQVPPPTLDGLGLSFRVPMIVISPWTPAGRIVNSLGYFESLLHFMELRFGLGCITSRDCYAPLPWGYFDFNMTERSPMLFPTNATMATYPLTAAESAMGLASRYAINPTTWDSLPPPPGTAYTSVD